MSEAGAGNGRGRVGTKTSFVIHRDKNWGPFRLASWPLVTLKPMLLLVAQ
jgi:hypothetical protein